ncbi:MotA/TolQ/ExbB proton channel family protein [Veillonella rodentium]|uniref:Biopolymer transport protein exbB n=1 Tax=Veillonella rodentium TaxID=248315 RepID=A0A239Y6S3_9FIRM|nr:MotA/TolQ/ExbB proton channel family protein [Veillonella rodentium]SNV54400.1 Biopolymer transport protein exbB [Veillonella rodentium]
MEYAIHLFNAGGAVMYPLALFMVAAWTILFERIRTYRKINDELKALHACIDQAQTEKNWDVLQQAIDNDRQELSVFMAPIIDSVYNLEGLENRLQDVVAYMDARLKRGLNWLNMMVTMAPLLGLLGTVVGMIRSFAAVGGDIGAPTVITGGVSEALIATATGLSVAIVALAFYSWCSDKVNTNISVLEQNLGSILDIFNRSHMK